MWIQSINRLWKIKSEVRREQARKFDSGETDIIVSTDAAMGMNLPIKRIVFPR